MHRLTMERLTDAVRRVVEATLRSDDGADVVPDQDVVTALRLRCGEIVVDGGASDLQQTLREHDGTLRRLMITRWLNLAHYGQEDLAGLIDVPEDADAATMVARLLLRTAGKALAAACDDLFPGEKWLWRQLDRSAPVSFPHAHYRHLLRADPLGPAGDAVSLIDLRRFAQTCLAAAGTLGWHGAPMAHWPRWRSGGGPLHRVPDLSLRVQPGRGRGHLAGQPAGPVEPRGRAGLGPVRWGRRADTPAGRRAAAVGAHRIWSAEPSPRGRAGRRVARRAADSPETGMKLTYVRSRSLDLYLALHRELVGRCSWEVATLPRPVEPAIAAFLAGLQGWRAKGVPIPPAMFVSAAGPERTDEATRAVSAAMEVARPLFAPVIEAFDERRTLAEADLYLRACLSQVADALAAAMGTPDSALELPVYLVPFAPYPPSVGLLLDGARVAGAYLDFRRYVGSTLADAVLTQLGWALLRTEHGPGNLLRRLQALLPGTGPYQRRLRLLLTKTLVELTAGHLVRMTDPTHRPCVEVLGTAWRFPRLYDLARRHWTRYLHGHLDRERALAAIAEEAARYTPRWYVENIDGAALAADFYLLEWLAAQDDAEARELRLARWAPQLSADFAGQLDLIIGTELGHYECARLDTFPADLAAFLRQVNLGDSRVGWWRARRELGEIPALDLAVDAFAGPGVEYGGEAWAPIAAMLRRYAAGELPARVFIDQCFTLQHNNGCLFDKYFEAEHLMPVLEAQAAGDLATLARHASSEVRRRWQRHRYRLERDYSPEWLGTDRVVDVPPPEPPRTTRLTIGAPPPGGLGCGSSEEAEQLAASHRDATEAIRTRTRQFRRPVAGGAAPVHRGDGHPAHRPGCRPDGAVADGCAAHRRQLRGARLWIPAMAGPNDR